MTAWAQRLPLARMSWERRIAVAGIVLGAAAFWCALPPLKSRAIAVPIALGIVAVACGIYAWTRGERHVGGGAAVAGVVGIVLGVLATNSSVGHLESVVTWSALVAAMLRYATPLTFAAIGGMFNERSGVVNIALEGMMLSGAFFGIWADVKTGSWALGLLAAIASGAAFALIHAFFSIHLRADQIVAGTAINFLAVGVTGYLFIQQFGDQGTPGTISQIPDVHLSFLDGVYFIGPAFSQLNLMIYFMFATLILSYIVIFRTPFGLRLRACGEHPRAADTVGINVYRMRYIAVLISGILASLGGAYLSLGFVHSFNENMTSGRGFIGLAALIFGNWRPLGAFGAACLFGFASAIADRMQTYNESLPGIDVLIQSLPYALTLIAVAGVIGRSIPPAAVGRPYEKQ